MPIRLLLLNKTLVLAMGSGKKEAARRERQGKAGDGLDNVKTKGENFYRYGFEYFNKGFWEGLTMSAY